MSEHRVPDDDVEHLIDVRCGRIGLKDSERSRRQVVTTPCDGFGVDIAAVYLGDSCIAEDEGSDAADAATPVEQSVDWGPSPVMMHGIEELPARLEASTLKRLDV